MLKIRKSQVIMPTISITILKENMRPMPRHYNVKEFLGKLMGLLGIFGTSERIDILYPFYQHLTT